MRHTSVQPFIQQINQKKHLPKCLVIITSNVDERKALVEMLIGIYQKMFPKIEIENMLEPLVETLLGFLSNLSLFSSHRLFLIDNLKASEKQLNDFMRSLSDQDYVIFSFAYPVHIKDIPTLDLSKEKPWDKPSRLSFMLGYLAYKKGITIHSGALQLLIDSIGSDFCTLNSEIEKLYANAKDQKITIDTVKSLPITIKALSTFQLVDEVLWGKSSKALSDGLQTDVSQMIGPFRYRLRQALEIWQCRKEKKSFNQMPTLSSLSKSQLEKYQKYAAYYRVDFYKKALASLFHLELSLRDYLDESICWDIFVAKLSTLKDIHAVHST